MEFLIVVALCIGILLCRSLIIKAREREESIEWERRKNAAGTNVDYMDDQTTHAVNAEVGALTAVPRRVSAKKQSVSASKAGRKIVHSASAEHSVSERNMEVIEGPRDEKTGLPKSVQHGWELMIRCGIPWCAADCKTVWSVYYDRENDVYYRANYRGGVERALSREEYEEHKLYYEEWLKELNEWTNSIKK